MSLRNLYTDVILDHYKNPRNKHAVENATHHAKGHNPLCGDKLVLYIRVAEGVIEDIGFTGQGCAIHTASTSIMTEKVKGKSIAETKELIAAFLGMIVGRGEASEELLGELIVLEGVKDLLARIKCATLSWHTIDLALFKGDAAKEGDASASSDAEGLEME
jgi:nitrogen fixation NifU-like protein